MPTPDKAVMIQDMLQQRKPVPDSVEWWREVAQGLGVKLFDANARIKELEAVIAARPLPSGDTHGE